MGIRVGIVAVLAVACAPSQMTQNEWNALPASPLPAMVYVGDADARPPPDGCDWALAPDALVWGTIRDVRLVATPAVLVSGPNVGALTDQCTGVVNHALELLLDVEHTLAGAADQALTVRIGKRHLDLFSPRPRLQDGATVWEPQPGTNPGLPLEIGQKIGLPVFVVPGTEMLSVMGQALFGVGIRADGAREIRFQSFAQVDGGEPAPTAFNGMTFNDMAVAVRSCGARGDAAQARRTLVNNVWGPATAGPAASYAAVCFE